MQGVRHNRWIEGLRALFRVSMNLAILEPSGKSLPLPGTPAGWASFIKGLATIDQVSGLTDGEQRPFCSRAPNAGLSMPRRMFRWCPVFLEKWGGSLAVQPIMEA